ncbi:MAG: hypothetical protein COA42_06145 [Alteromonadaceae bacterium]|nr:MAG: hypothetical protein COA42_06145 [Alteromonadaceae bacterium]
MTGISLCINTLDERIERQREMKEALDLQQQPEASLMPFGAFPYVMCLIGLRDIRDYRIFSDETQKFVIDGSAFNIKEESCTLFYWAKK